MPTRSQVDDDRFLTADEVADYLGCSGRTVRRQMAAGELPCAPRISSRQPYKVALIALKKLWKERAEGLEEVVEEFARAG